MMNQIDLNCDLGEGFGNWRIDSAPDDALIPLISSANIATGFHAGDPNIMRHAVELAKANKVGVGVHPGFRDLVGFGRRHMAANAQELVNDIVYQIGALREFTRLAKVPLHHLKPHGSLYMHAMVDEVFARTLVTALQETDPTLPIYCVTYSQVFHVARELGQPVVREFYGDRDYDNQGHFLFTRSVAKYDPAKVAAKIVQACLHGTVTSVDGKEVPVEFDSVCIHSDTPGSVDLLKATRAALAQNKIDVAQFTVSHSQSTPARGTS